MVSEVNKHNFIACEKIKQIVPHQLRKKIEAKNLLNGDITAIAQSIFIQKNEDGSFLVKKKDTNKKNLVLPNTDIGKLRQEIALIRSICTNGMEQPRDKIQIKREQKGKAKSTKCEDDKLSKKQIQKKPIKSVKDMFSVESEIPDSVRGIMAEYMVQSTAAIISFVTCREVIPKYLKDNITYFAFNSDFATFKTVISELKNLKSINLPSCADSSWIAAVIEKLPNLEDLDISYCHNLKDIDLYSIANNLLSLKNLNITGCRFKNGPIDPIFKTLRLQKLNLDSCDNITDKAFKSIKESEESLEDLDLESTSITDTGLSYIVESAKNIKRLSLRHCHYITDDLLDLAIRFFKELEHLDVSGCMLSDNGLINLNQRYQTLQSLKLDGCKNITGEFLANFTKTFEVLKNISLAFMSKLILSNLNHLSGKIPAIENLNLNSLHALMREIRKIVHGATKLEVLNLTSTHVNDKELIKIANGCPNLKILTLDQCHNIFNAGLRAIFNGCKKLQELSLEECINLDDNSFRSIAKKPCKLIRIDVSGSRKLTQIAFRNIVKGCPELINLSLYWCNITRDNIFELKDINKEVEIGFDKDHSIYSDKEIE